MQYVKVHIELILIVFFFYPCFMCNSVHLVFKPFLDQNSNHSFAQLAIRIQECHYNNVKFANVQIIFALMSTTGTLWINIWVT